MSGPGFLVARNQVRVIGDTCTRGGHRETLVDGMLSMRFNLKGAAHLSEKTC